MSSRTLSTSIALTVGLLITLALPSAAQIYTQEQLIEDVRQLAQIIEDVHPDPFLRCGGRIAFYRQVDAILSAIPDQGMTRESLGRLLRPLVASIGDSHTQIWAGYKVGWVYPRGVPLRFGIVESALYVEAVHDEEELPLVGSRLLSVEGLGLSELMDRQRRLVATENEYHVLQELSSGTLLHEAYLEELIPEWVDHSSVRVGLQLPTGEHHDLVFDLPRAVIRAYGAGSQITLPRPDESGFLFDFIDPLMSGEEVGYLRVSHLNRYREDSEVCIAVGVYDMTDEELLAIPSATETFREMVLAMEERETDTLIVDLRGNDGGDSLMSDILIYSLYGADRLRKVMTVSSASGGGVVKRYSQMYLNSRRTLTLDGLSEGRDVPLQVGDYDFSAYYADDIERFEELAADPEAILYPFQRSYPRTPTFYEELVSEEHGGRYCPENVIVLVDPGTFSSAFTMMRDLYRAGATLVGTPSGQASNVYGNALNYRLDHTGLEGIVSFSYYVEFPNDPDLGRLIPMHVPLTYEFLESTGFDPNAEMLLALDWLEQDEMEAEEEGK